MAFDPDKFLAAGKEPEGFDPDAFLKATETDWDSSEPLKESMKLPEEGSMLRDFAMGTSDVLKSVSAFPSMLYDVAALPVNLGIKGINLRREKAGEEPLAYIPSGQSYVNRALEVLGLPEAPEGIGSAARQGAASALGSFGLGSAIPASKAGLSAVREALTSTPLTQSVAGATGAIGSEVAREAGAGAPGQILAGILGGGLGGYGSSRLGTAMEVSPPISALGGYAVAAPSGQPSLMERFAKYFEPAREKVAPLLTETKPRQIPSTEQFYQAAGSAYKAADSVGAVIRPDKFLNFVNDIPNKDVTSKLGPLARGTSSADQIEKLYPKSSSAFNMLKNRAEAGDPISLSDVQELREIIGDAAGTMDKADSRIAMNLKSHLDDFISNVGQGDLMAGDPSAFSAWADARKLYARASGSKEIEQIIANSEFSASQRARALSQSFRSLAKNQKRLRMYSPEQQEAIKELARAPVNDVALWVGSLGNNPTKAMMSMFLGSHFAGPLGAVVAPAVGAGAQALANRSAMGRAARLSEFMKTGEKPLTLTQDVLQRGPEYIPGAALGAYEQTEEEQ